jgi:hypothetical protein
LFEHFQFEYAKLGKGDGEGGLCSVYGMAFPGWYRYLLRIGLSPMMLVGQNDQTGRNVGPTVKAHHSRLHGSCKKAKQ